MEMTEEARKMMLQKGPVPTEFLRRAASPRCTCREAIRFPDERREELCEAKSQEGAASPKGPQGAALERASVPDTVASSELSRRREEFIDNHSALFWYTPEDRKHAISDELLVETILNEGTLDDFRELKDVLTPKRVAQVFFGATPRQIGNYYPEIRHFFSLVLKEYA